MVTRSWPITLVEPISEGIKGRAADAATRRVMDGVCRHGHVEVLMGIRSNGEVVKDRP